MAKLWPVASSRNLRRAVVQTATRIPEALWFQFDPITSVPSPTSARFRASTPPRRSSLQHFATPSPQQQRDQSPILGWSMNTLGSWLDPLDFVVNGSSHLHAVWDGVLYTDATT